jgi:DNA-binding LacI/PurR family transcriptional regulator
MSSKGAAKNHITAGDIAARLGLAPTTVSHVLAGRGDRVRIKADTQRRVLDAARELGYRPNASARAMRTGRFGSAAVIQPLRNVYLPSHLILGLAEELERHGMHLSVAQIPDETLDRHDLTAGFLPKVVRELTADGLLINMIVGIPDEFVAAIEAHSIPTVWINSRHGADCVHPDDEGNARLAAEHLLSLGHRRIAYVQLKNAGAGPPHYSEGDRFAGYAAAMRAAGLAPRRVTLPPVPTTYEAMAADRRAAEAEAFLRGLPAAERPTALLCYELDTAMPCLLGAAAAGLSVPGDLSVMMFHNTLDQLTGRGITALIHHVQDLGHEAARMLVEKVREPGRSLPPRALPGHVLPGATTGPPPPGG